ncbi:ThiF family adenylyltransferase [Chitinophaga oryziterrae]|uniref:ThiF family adenylyltransferase n=1 Tax=Chitinophaga oryziterrae TaxID=1031224 RepID=A0A6N8J4S6_9BACT|nr:ThiF family adenylyltransferase [Chitinophaga oryziterrae]MVT40227.1 ThiF family adenylyltransferase [Chitinophaga oryziterrae]
MEWNSQSLRLVSHNDDLKKLRDKGYAIALDSDHLVIRDIPYLDEHGELKVGAIVCKLLFIDKDHVHQDDHQIYFSGSHPYELNGLKIANFGGGPVSIQLQSPDIKVERSFSNKPTATGKYADHFEKIENYVALISGPAMEKYPEATPYTFKEYVSVGDSIFKFNDSLTSRAGIGDLSARFNDEVIAIIGLGGTGAYILDFLVKTPVQQIRGFDLDTYHIHNAFRSPGALSNEELGQSKAEVYQRRYENFRHGLQLEPKFILAGSEDELAGVTFAFVCVDKGESRAKIHELLLKLYIPFIDVGVGLNRDSGAISGLIRTTYYSAESAQAIAEKKLAPMADYPDDVYKANIQISELNALNASIAVLRYKQIRGFYRDDNKFYNMLFDISDNRNVGENEL